MKTLPIRLCVLVLTASMTACMQGTVEAPQRQTDDAELAQPSPPADNVPLVVFLGDSLAAGFRLPANQAFPAVSGELLEQEGYPVRIVNAGVSGDTTAGGVSRLSWLLRQRPDVLVVELGGNDGLRGLPLEMTERNLRAIVQRARDEGARVLLLGMYVPTSHGPEYATGFREIYVRVAREFDVAFSPGFLLGVGGRPELNLADGIHPTPEGHRRLAENILPALRDIVRSLPDS